MKTYYAALCPRCGEITAGIVADSVPLKELQDDIVEWYINGKNVFGTDEQLIMGRCKCPSLRYVLPELFP